MPDQDSGTVPAREVFLHCGQCQATASANNAAELGWLILTRWGEMALSKATLACSLVCMNQQIAAQTARQLVGR